MDTRLLPKTIFLGLALFVGWAWAENPPPNQTLAELADPLFPGGGPVFRGASLPYGMILFGPRTGSFHTFVFSGAGASGMQTGIWLRPYAGDRTVNAQGRMELGPFQRGRHQAGLGWMRSDGDDGTVLEATATPRGALLRISYPADKPGYFLLPRMKGGEPTVRVEGRQASGFSNRQYFALELDTDPLAVDTVAVDDTTREGGSEPERVRLSFAPGSTVRIRLGVSWTDEAGALLNLRAELPDWDFDRVREAAADVWANHLNRFSVEGGTAAQRRAFASYLHRASLHMNITEDVDGRYRGFDGEVHQVVDRHHYSSFSGWDVYRTWVPWLAMTDPGRMSQVADSLLRSTLEGGAYPRWSTATRDHPVMIGQPGVISVAWAYILGARRFDAERALGQMVLDATVPGRRCTGVVARPRLEETLKLGYVPAPEWYSVCLTLEFGLADFTIAQLAGALGRQDLHGQFLKRSENWRHLLHPETRYMQARDKDGAWFAGRGASGGFVESTSHHMTWFVPQQQAELIEAIGGPEVAIQRLDRFFSELSRMETHPEFASLNNQPSYHTPWIYGWVGQPWKTAEVVRRALDEIWLPGRNHDDDLGTAAAWGLWAMAGLYPVIPGEAGFMLHGPLFERVAMPFGEGKTLEIIAHRSDPSHLHVQSVTVNGRPHTSPWLPLALLDQAANTVGFTMGPEPGGEWGEGIFPRPSN